MFALKKVFLLFSFFFRYITALTDSEEEESNDEGQSGQEEPADELSILLNRIDTLHEGTASDKRESLNTLLEKREEVC